MFEPATHGLLAYSLTDCATRKLSNFLQIRTIKEKSFLLFQKEVRHVTEVSHSPLRKYATHLFITP